MDNLTSNDYWDINEMSNTLFKLYDALIQYKKIESSFSDKSLNELRKIEVQALLLAARIDVTICFDKIKQSTNKYEGFFFLNIAFMKMNEILKTIYFIITKTNNSLHYNPHPESRREIEVLITEWRNQYGDWIKQKRNNSIAHYESDFLKFINNGYIEIDREKNQECFISFYEVIRDILDSIKKYNPIDLQHTATDIKKYIKI